MHAPTAPPSSRSQHRSVLLPLVPAALATLVAIGQWTLTRTDHLSPWKGGGFGMFSTNDRATSRGIRIWVVDGERERRVDVPSPLLAQAGTAATLPSPDRLRELAQGVMSLEQAGGDRPTQVRVQVVRTDYAVHTLAPRRRLLREHVLER